MSRDTLEKSALDNCPAEWFYELQDNLENVTDEQLEYLSNVKEINGRQIIVQSCWNVDNSLCANVGIHDDDSGVCFYHRLTILNDTLLFGFREKVLGEANRIKQHEQRLFLENNVMAVRKLIQSLV